MIIKEMMLAFPGLVNGQDEVNGADLVEWLTLELASARQKRIQLAMDTLIHYVLCHEAEDFYSQVTDGRFLSKEEFRNGWRDVPHIFVDALIACDELPEWQEDEFESY